MPIRDELTYVGWEVGKLILYAGVNILYYVGLALLIIAFMK